MREDLDAGLVKQFPKLFKERYMPMTHTCMCWGFEHGDGWYSIIASMCHLIQGHITWTRSNRARALRFNRALRRAIAGNRRDIEHFYSVRDHETGLKKLGQISEWAQKQMAEEIAEARFRPVPEACSQVVINQVKEKFGTLRFYYTGGDAYVDGVVRMGEEMSAVTCEDCGAPGRSRRGGWIRTLCDTHAQERDVVDEQAF